MENNISDLELKRFHMFDDEGNLIGDLSVISLVTDPAIELSYQLFQKVGVENFKFTVTNNERMEITGPCMVPNKAILRQNPTTGDYFNGYWTEEDVRGCRDYYMMNGNNLKANFEHEQQFTNDLVVVNSWIVEDPENDTAIGLGFPRESVTKGSWWVTYKCKSIETWNKIKASSLTGFSVEGKWGLYTSIKKDFEEDMNEILDELIFSKEEKKEAVNDILSFHQFVSVGQLTFTDYPQAAISNIKDALRFKKANPDLNCGSKVTWARASQIAAGKSISYSTVKLMSLYVKNQLKQEKSTYEKGCSKILWDAMGGDEGIYWAIQKMQQIDSLVKEEQQRLEAERRNKLLGY